MAEVKTYPQLSSFTTSTVLACAQCKTEIKMFSPVVTDGKSYWHKGCESKSAEPSEVHTVDFPKDDKEK
jgi:hypothetical protein